jgi:hypothetical protein
MTAVLDDSKHDWYQNKDSELVHCRRSIGYMHVWTGMSSRKAVHSPGAAQGPTARTDKTMTMLVSQSKLDLLFC